MLIIKTIKLNVHLQAASEANQFFKGTKLDILPETKTETIKSNSELTMSDFSE